MKNIYKIALATVLSATATSMTRAAHLGDKLTFSARMTGAQEVPAVTTTGQGVASFTLNGTRDTMCISVYMAGTMDLVNGIHLHSGMSGINGAVVLDLTPYLSNGNVQAVITGTELTTSLISDMITGGIYINAHTAGFPNGEIRGQVKLETDFPYRAELNGQQEVPAVATSATGLGVFNLSLDKKKLMYWVSADSLSGAIMGAHLHVAASGSNGPVVVDLTGSIMGNAIVGVADISSFVGFDDDLAAGNVYVNLHTAANMNGEIRGQLTYDNQVAFDGFLNGMAEVPAVTTPATGVAEFSLSSDFTSINYRIQVEGLSGAIMGAHLHEGAAGTNGPVVVNLTPNVVGNTIQGTISGAELTPELIIELLESNIYLNVHTAANMNGEIRAQINRVAREGYAVNMTGDQEVPAVMTSASGGGIVTISRERNNAHVMLVVKDLSGPLQGAHFHNAAAGANGAVEFDLTPWFAGTGNFDGAYGYLTADDAVPMNATAEVKFRNNEMYTNVHTTANMNGEIRGQVIRGSECMVTPNTAGIDELETINVSVYPNPTENKLTISIENIDGDVSFIITDLSGKVVNTGSTKQQETVVDLSSVQNGIYLLKVGNTTTRIVKN